MRYCPVCKASYQAQTRCLRDRVELVADSDPLLGAVLGQRYRIVDRIASGGMGQVYRASHTRLASQFAVKVLYGEYGSELDMRQRFEREAEAASILQSRYIARVIDFGETETGLLYLVMELLDGVSMAAALTRDERFAAARTVGLVRKLALGLAHAHQRGVIHRDLKPQNVMLVSEDGEGEVPKIVDFGIARINERPGVTLPGMVFGTPAYMAPEQFTGGQVDARTDLYALGVILYQCVVGHPPFDGASTSAVLQAQRTAAPPPLSAVRPALQVPPDFEELVLKLLAKRPADRFSTATELVEALDRLGSPVPEVTRRALNPLTPAGVQWAAGVEEMRVAIQRGAPLYNQGDQSGCAQLYQLTAESLVARLTSSGDGAFRARLEAALHRASVRDAAGAAWELRHAFDDLLFGVGELKRHQPADQDTVVRRRASRFAADFPGLERLRRELDFAALVAARRYEAGNVPAVGDYYLRLAEDLCQRLAAEEGGAVVRVTLFDALEKARHSQGSADAAAILGDAFDALRFDGVDDEAPPPQAAVLAVSEQINEFADAVVATIREGSALYNAGDVEACARLYAGTAETLLASLGPSPRNAAMGRMLKRALDRASAATPDDGAWALRHAFDALLEARQVAVSPQAVSAAPRERG